MMYYNSDLLQSDMSLVMRLMASIMSFPKPILWSHGMAKCPSWEVVGDLCTFHVLFYEYYEYYELLLAHILFFAYLILLK